MLDLLMEEKRRLHLNDVIISDAASCNQGQGTQREIRREVLYAWIDGRSRRAAVSFVFYLPQWQSKKGSTKRDRGESKRQTLKR